MQVDVVAGDRGDGLQGQEPALDRAIEGAGELLGVQAELPHMLLQQSCARHLAEPKGGKHGKDQG